MRVVVIAASFPFKEQVKEFQSKLGLRSEYEVISEPAARAGRRNYEYARGRTV